MAKGKGRSWDIFSSRSRPTMAELKKLSKADVSFIRCYEGLYIADKKRGQIEYTPFDLHSETRKAFDEKFKPSDIPRMFSEEEAGEIFSFLEQAEYKIAFGNHFDRCYPQEAASLSFGRIPKDLVYRSTDRVLKIKEEEVEERTIVLCGGDSLWWLAYSGYHLPLCEHLEKLLKNPFIQVNEMLLTLINEVVLFRREDERAFFTRAYYYLSRKLGLTPALEMITSGEPLQEVEAASKPKLKLESQTPFKTKESMTLSEAGKIGIEAKKKLHEPARQVVKERAKFLWASNSSLTIEGVTEKVGLHLISLKILNPSTQECYPDSQIRIWVTEVIPKEKSRGGRPKKSEAL